MLQIHRRVVEELLVNYRMPGSLVVAWDPAEMEHLEKVLEDNRAAGDTDAKLVTRAELRAMEPALSAAALGAVLCPWETVVEPWLLPVG